MVPAESRSRISLAWVSISGSAADLKWASTSDSNWNVNGNQNWLPLGGFVRIKGETDPNVAGGLMTANQAKVLGGGRFFRVGFLKGDVGIGPAETHGTD